jgi:hypothetical protein
LQIGSLVCGASYALGCVEGGAELLGGAAYVANLLVVVVDKDVAVAGRVDIALDDSPRSLYDLGNLGVSDVPSCIGVYALLRVRVQAVACKTIVGAKAARLGHLEGSPVAGHANYDLPSRDARLGDYG